FRLGSWAANDRVIIDANPHYGQQAGTKRIVIRHVPDPSVQLLLLQKGDADIARDLGAEQLRSVAGNPDYHVVQAPQAGSLYVAMNQSVPELARPGVRQAIKWAIDYDLIARNITPGTWRVNQSFLAGGLLGEIEEQPFHKDLARARRLMADAGLAEGFATSMDHFSNAPFADIAQVVQQNLGEIGIRVQLIAGEGKQVVTKTRARNHQLAMLTRAIDYFDANGGSQAFCANPDDSDDSKLKVFAWRSHFVDPELTAAVAAAAKELDTAKRVTMYRAIQRTWWDRAPFAIMLQPNATSVLRKDVTGLAVGPLADYTKFQRIRKS
ncbi:MAG TPA: ABC transporter substrate-binding protein, partial [Acetobacteraceae bacterium]